MLIRTYKIIILSFLFREMSIGEVALQVAETTWLGPGHKSKLMTKTVSNNERL